MNLGGKLGGLGGLGGGQDDEDPLKQRYEEKRAQQQSIAADYGEEGFPDLNRPEQPRTQDALGMGRVQRTNGFRSLSR